VRDRTNGGSSFYVIGTVALLVGIAFAVLKWHAEPRRESQWQAFSAGGSPGQPRPTPMPTVIGPK
jgi:hypothetical protein